MPGFESSSSELRVGWCGVSGVQHLGPSPAVWDFVAFTVWTLCLFCSDVSLGSPLLDVLPGETCETPHRCRLFLKLSAPHECLPMSPVLGLHGFPYVRTDTFWDRHELRSDRMFAIHIYDSYDVP